jgi:SAM-dependent methyltransferase
VTPTGAATERWRDALGALAIPEPILAAAPESPWGFPPELFASRNAEPEARAEAPTTLRALEALPAAGAVLDVGVGGGATSLPLAGRASAITGVDGSGSMLEVFRSAAAKAGVAAETVQGTWPDVAYLVAHADVVVSGHTFYNVPKLAPFVRALTTHARRRVVVELTTEHPLAWTADLWRRFHAYERPDGPFADDAEAVIRELGLEVRRDELETDPRPGGFARREDAVALVRKRLCLPAERDDEIAEALGERLAERDGRWSAGPGRSRLVTLWWPGEG